MKKRFISMLILIAYLVISFPVCMPAVAIQTVATVSYYSPAIKAEVGDTIDLTGFGVEFENGVLTEAGAISWASDAVTITDGKISATAKGTFKLTATAGDVTKNIYLLVKKPEDKEYVIYEDDFEVDKTYDEFKADGYVAVAKPSGHTVAVADGALKVSAATTKTTTQLVLPTWIGDFGNYSISADITVSATYNNTQYFALSFRGQNELSYAPFYHTAYRVGTSDTCFELCHKYVNGTSTSWGTAITAGYAESIKDGVQRNYRVDVVGDNVKNYVDSELIHDVDYIPQSSNGNIEYYKGNVGILVKGCDVQFDSIKVILKENEETILESEEFVIKADVGDIIPIDTYGIEFEDGVIASAANVDWTSDAVSIVNGQVAATAKGAYKLTATAGDVTKNIYLLVKNPEDDEYVIYEDDFEVNKTLAELKEDGYIHAQGSTGHSIAVADGVLKISAAANTSTTRFVLPTWIEDFGNYSISADVRVTKTKNASQYFSLMFRAQTELSNQPYYHTAYRVNNTVDGCELTTRYINSSGSAAWGSSNTILSAYSKPLNDSVLRNYRVNVFDKNVKNFIDGQLIHDADFIPKSANGYIEYYKGRVGILVKGCDVEVEKITVTLMEKESDGIMTHVAEKPESNVQPAPMSVLSVDAESDFDFESAPMVAMLRANKALELVNAEGEKIMTLAEAITRLDGKIIPAFYVDDAEAVADICEFIQKNFLHDAFIVSDDAEIIKSARAILPMLRGVLDFSRATITDLYTVRKQTNECGASIALLPESHSDRQSVDYLLRLYMNVWVTMKDDSNVAAVTSVTSGANGVVTGDVDVYNNALVNYFDDKTITRPIIVSGHRGAYYSEQRNTVAGIIKAHELGAMSAEIDLRLTSDGVIILMHDSTIDAETNGTGKVSEMTYAEISQYQADEYTGVDPQPIATFEEALIAAKELDDFQLLVEIKETNTEICQKIADLITQYDMANKVNIIAYDEAIIAGIREAMPEMSLGILPETAKADDTDPEIEAYNIINMLNTYNASYAPSYTKIGTETLKALNDRGIGVYTWTVNGKAALNNNLTLGFGSVTTNTVTSFTNVTKWIYTDKKEYTSDNGVVPIELTAVTYGRATSAVTDAKLVFLEGDDIFSYANGKITASGNGSATLMLSAEFADLNGGKINLVTEPFKVTVSSDTTNGTTGVGYDNEAIIVEVAKAYDRQGAQIPYDKKNARRSIYASPEDATAQRTFFLDCSSYVNSIYREAFGVNVMPYEINAQTTGSSPTTSNFDGYARDHQAAEDVVGYWEPQTYTTDGDRQAVADWISENIEIGDIVVYLHGKSTGTSGHVYIYIGDNTFMHCAGAGSYVANADNPALSYDSNASEITSNGTIGTVTFSNIFENKDSSRYIFKQSASDTVWSFGIIRPLARGLTPTEETINRMKIAGLSMEKTASVWENNSVNTGDILTYTVTMENTNDTALNGVTITDTLPEGTEFVSGDDGVSVTEGVLSWTGDVGASSTVKVNYSVKITATVPGTIITSDATYVSGVKLGSITHSVSGYSKTQCALISDTAVKYAEESRQFTNGLELANEVYKSTFGIDIFGDATVVSALDQLIDTANRTRHNSTELSKMIAPNMYGGLAIRYGRLYYPEENYRTSLPMEEHLAPGDIILADWSGGNAVYVYAGNKTLVTVEDGVSKALSIGDDIYTPGNNIIISLLGYERYAVLRPSMGSSVPQIDVSSIKVTTPPSKTEYKGGEAFDKEGMVVQATMNDSSVKNLSAYTVSPMSLKYTDNYVTIRFGDLSTTVDVKVTDTTTSVSEAAVLDVGTTVRVEGIVVGVAHEGLNNDKEMLLKDISKDTIMSVRDIPYGNFPDFGYEKGDRIVFEATVKKDTSSSTCYNEKKYLSFSSNNGDIDETVISKGNKTTYKFDNVTELDSWEDMQNLFKKALKPYTYVKISGGSYCQLYHGTDTDNYRVHKNSLATDGVGLRTDGTRQIAIRDDVNTANIGPEWKSLLFDGAEISTDYPGIEVDKDFYALYIGGNGVYYQLVILDEKWICDGEFPYGVAQNETTGVGYETLDEALDNAVSGDTIKMLEDAETRFATVREGVTLDINGHKLTADYVTGFDDSNIIDSNVAEDSGIYVAKKQFAISENNSQLPIYDSKNGCYMFTDVILEYTYYEDSSYYFGPEMAALDTVEGERVNALLRENSADTGINIIVHLDWETDDYFSTQDFTYKPTYVEQYFQAAKEDGHYYNVYFYARFMGDVLKQADSVTVTTIVQSDRGAQFVSKETEFSLKS